MCLGNFILVGENTGDGVSEMNFKNVSKVMFLLKADNRRFTGF